ncbi:MAG TPA: hypothetical protein VKQ34_01150, partial [Candidatus Saccharimonadales bacterium]|nr:hypothetical protein [Candidatus Saccharimonadales bacterium]
TATIAEALRRTGRLASTDTTAGNDISDQLLEEVITWVFEATNPNTPNPSRQTYETLLQAEVYRLAKALSDDLIKTATCQLMDTTALNLLKRPATDSEARKPALPEHTALKGDAALNAEMAEKLRKIHIGEVVYARQPDGVQRIVRYTQGEQLGGLNGRRPDLALRLDQPSWLTPHLTGYTTIAYNPKRKIYYFQRAEVDPHRHCDTPLPEDALPRLAANLAAQGFTALSSKLAESDTMTVGELERLIKTENTYWIPSETIVLSNSNYGLARFQQFAENGRIGGWCTVHSELLTSLLRSAFGAENNPHINIRTIGGPVVMTDTKIVDALEHAEVEFTDPVTGETYLLNPTPASGQPDSSKPVGVRGGASVIRSLRENGREFAATQAQRIKRIGAWAARLATSRKPKEKEDAPLTVAALERMAATAGEPEAVTAEEKVRIVERQLIRQLRTIWGYGIQAKDDEYVRDRIFSRLNSLPPFDPLLRTARLIQQAQPAGNLPARTDTVGIEQDIRLIEQDLAMLRRLERARTDPDTAAELDIDPRLLMRQGKTYFTNPAMIDLVDGTLRQLRSALGLKALPQSRRR